MGVSPHPSHITMPMAAPPYPTVLAFICRRFPAVAPETWEKRIADGKVLDGQLTPINTGTGYAPGKRIYYFREIENEQVIPFVEQILFQDDHLLVACKPHFLPVTPTGRYVDECLLNRLRKRTGIPDLAPLHRIDRETAGLVLFSVNKGTRSLYSRLFLQGNVDKSYQAVSAHIPLGDKTAWLVEDRIELGDPWFRMKTAPGTVNARSMIDLVEVKEGKARFMLRPISGKTHQLRIHMCGLGFGILNDRYYPELQPESEDDFDAPLQLVAKSVRFQDPVTGEIREFVSGRELLW